MFILYIYIYYIYVFMYAGLESNNWNSVRCTPFKRLVPFLSFCNGRKQVCINSSPKKRGIPYDLAVAATSLIISFN